MMTFDYEICLFIVHCFMGWTCLVRNRADAFDASTMAHLQYLLVQKARTSNNVSLNVVDSDKFLEITFQPKVRNLQLKTRTIG
jgi:hypothetical protein